MKNQKLRTLVYIALIAAILCVTAPWAIPTPLILADLRRKSFRSSNGAVYCHRRDRRSRIFGIRGRICKTCGTDGRIHYRIFGACFSCGAYRIPEVFGNMETHNPAHCGTCRCLLFRHGMVRDKHKNIFLSRAHALRCAVHSV